MNWNLLLSAKVWFINISLEVKTDIFKGNQNATSQQCYICLLYAPLSQVLAEILLPNFQTCYY